MVKIGYQGERGSNNEAAAEQFANEQNFDEYELIPLVESRYVVSSLKSKKIDYGIVATRNSVAGPVKEAYEAIKDEYFEFVQTIILPIHHCLFIKQNASINEINTVISHVQALEQTKQTLHERFPQFAKKETNDTASAARYLSEGIFSDNCAVICRKNAGEMYNLKLIAENIEDDRGNRTEFRVFKNPTIDYSGTNKPNIFQWLLYQLANENGTTYIA